MNDDSRGNVTRNLPELIHGTLTYRIIGVFYGVHHDLGGGFLESVYSNALAIGLTEAGLSFEREVPLEVRFRGRIIGQFRADFVVESAILLEIKASNSIHEQHCIQVLNYLRCTDIEVGLLLCFGERANHRRFVVEKVRKPR